MDDTAIKDVLTMLDGVEDLDDQSLEELLDIVVNELNNFYAKWFSSSTRSSELTRIIAHHLRRPPGLFVRLMKRLRQDVVVCTSKKNEIVYVLWNDDHFSGEREYRPGLYSRNALALFPYFGLGAFTQLKNGPKEVHRYVSKMTPKTLEAGMKGVAETLYRRSRDRNASDDQKHLCRMILRKFALELEILPASLYLHDIVYDFLNQLPARQGGSYADIYIGQQDRSKICLKRLRMNAEDKDKIIRNFGKEALVWIRLRHPNILPFLGVVQSGIHYALASPWMKKGNIMRHLRENPGYNRMKAILDIASGLSYLHDQQIVHADIKGENVVVDDEGNCLLADFGISYLASTLSMSKSKHIGGSSNWMAPELFHLGPSERKLSKAVDIYALGCTMYEIYTGNPPFCGQSTEAISKAVTSRERPQYPRMVISPDLWSLLERCWCQEPAERPSIQKVVDDLRFIPARRR